MLVIILGTVVAAILFYYYAIMPFSYWKNRGVEQGNPAWFFGDSWGMCTRTQSFPKMVQAVYSKSTSARYTGAYQFFTPTLILRDPELIKQVTVKDFDNFSDHRKFIAPEADRLWGKNLLSLTGQEWREMRNILSPSFTSSKMKTMFVLISECVDNFVQHFLNKDEAVITVELKEAFTRYTNDVIATTAFGVKVDSLAEPNNEFYTTGQDATSFKSVWKRLVFFGYLTFPSICKALKLPLLSEKVGSFFLNLVDHTIKTREEKGIIRLDMLNLLMQAKKGTNHHTSKHEEPEIIDTGFATALEVETGTYKCSKEITNEDIAAQAFIFFFGGFDSSSGLMCFMAYELAINQDIQERLRNEIRHTSEMHGGKLSYETLLKMKYMDMVISEILRKWPSNTASDRICTKPYTIEQVTPDETPLHLEKGTVVWLPIYALHHDPEYFPDPERFDPERFNDENKNNIKPYTYIPFGSGPRNCIGSRFALLEAKALFFNLLSHFEIVPVEKSTIPLKIDKTTFNMTAEGGFWFGFKRIVK